MAVKIITDAGSDLTISQAQELGVILVPMTIFFGNDEYRAGVNISNEKFYDLLAQSDALPTTSQPTPYEFEQAFKAVKENGDDAVVICLSSALSGTYQSARIAGADFDGIYVVDSLHVTISQRLLVEYALRLAGQGLSAQQIAAQIETVRDKLCIFAAVDTLDYLIKGGRLSKTAGFAGKVLGIRPILTIEKGALGVIAKARGMKGVITQLNSAIENTGGIDYSMPYMVGYSGTDRTNLDECLAGSTSIWGENTSNLLVGEVGSTIGTHTGPGLIVIAYFKK